MKRHTIKSIFLEQVMQVTYFQFTL